jgi:hypothetical protein
MNEPRDKPPSRKPGKQERLAEALRQNLHKRKAQTRARRGMQSGGPGIPEIRPENDKDSRD